ncbi:MAG: CHAT domain-containing protein [Lutibacter sp.]
MKRNYFIFAIFLLLNLFRLSAQDTGQLINKFMGFYAQDDIIGMNHVAETIINADPDNYAGYAFKAYASILKNDLASAEKYIATARNIQPVDMGSYGVSSYIAFIKGNTEEAQKLMDFSFQLRADESSLQATLGDVNQIGRFIKKDISALIEMVKSANAKTTGSPAIMQKYYNCQAQWQQGKECSDFAIVKSYFQKLQPHNPMVIAYADFHKGIRFYNVQKWEEAKTLLNAFLTNPTIQSSTAHYDKAQAYNYLSYYDDYNANTLYATANKGLSEIDKLGFPTFMNCQLLSRKMMALGNLKNTKEQEIVANHLLEDAKKIGYSYMEAQAYSTLGGIYNSSELPQDRLKGVRNLNQSYAIAKSLNDENLINDMSSNYALALWRTGKKEEAKQVMLNTFNSYLTQKRYSDAQLSANNLGFMYFQAKDYPAAVQMFRKAVDITENFRANLSAVQQLAVMNEHSSAYSGLIMSLQKTGNVSELFQVQDLNRSRLLRDKIDKNIKPVTLQQTQQLLKPDEVLLYYSEATPGEMIVSIITNNSASIGYNFPIESWIKIKKEFINLVNKKPNSVNGYMLQMNEELIDGKVVRYMDLTDGFKAKDYEQFVSLTTELLNSSSPEMIPIREKFLKQWYNYLIKPIESKLIGKKTIIISGESYLNYVPFETFMDGNNQFLIQKYNVKYIPSATIWASLQNRNYSENRKTLLAFGGATYKSPPGKDYVYPKHSAEDIYALQDEIDKKIKNNETNFSRELTELSFGGAAYLKGTLHEVNSIKNVIPDATIRTDQQMKESDIKALDKAGELANFKYIHIATHGFADDVIPEFSGVMMTQPTGGDGKEDTFLLAHEIAKLNLKADMAVLSACSTALGKIYGGEGINGLNSSFLSAGANNTLLSLWPVSDAGTMIFMTLVYDNLYTRKQSVEDAVNDAKREMMTGKYGEAMADANIWAPFVLNGK